MNILAKSLIHRVNYVEVHKVWCIGFVYFIFLCFTICKGNPSSTNDAKKQNYCCARQSKMIDVGHDISGDVIQVDIGQCKRYCPRQFGDDPGDPSKPAVLKCMPNMRCRARSSKLDKISSIQGIKLVEVVDTCDCVEAHSCKRLPYSLSLHIGTPYQTEVDVGSCSGSCLRHSCRPSRNFSITVQGPNGNEAYQIIEKCSCVSDCHRMDYMETVLDYSGVEIKKGMSFSDVKPNVRHINVGQCAGQCSGNTTETCFLRDKKNPKKCITGLYSTSQSCSPAKFKIFQYRTRRGSRREIIQITECACV